MKFHKSHTNNYHNKLLQYKYSKNQHMSITCKAMYMFWTVNLAKIFSLEIWHSKAISNSSLQLLR